MWQTSHKVVPFHHVLFSTHTACSYRSTEPWSDGNHRLQYWADFHSFIVTEGMKNAVQPLEMPKLFWEVKDDIQRFKVSPESSDGTDCQGCHYILNGMECVNQWAVSLDGFGVWQEGQKAPMYVGELDWNRQDSSSSLVPKQPKRNNLDEFILHSTTANFNSNKTF